MSLVCQTLGSLLAEKNGATPEEFLDRIDQIDLNDRKVDGRVAVPSVVACDSCGRTDTTRRRACAYCGTALPYDPFR